MTIDWWTLGFQTVNVLVLVGLLGHFFWKPVAAMIEQRRVAVTKAQADAAHAQAQATAALAKIEATRAGFVQERQAILAQAHADAGRARDELLVKGRQEAETMATQAAAASAQGQAAAEAAWRDRAGQLAVDIAARLCAPLAGPSVQAIFLDRLVEQIHALPPDWLRGMRSGQAEITVLSAMALTPVDEQRCRQRVIEALGLEAGGDPSAEADTDAGAHADTDAGTVTEAALRVVVRTDAALISGFDLHCANLVVRNSWQADLQRIGTELAHEQGA